MRRIVIRGSVIAVIVAIITSFLIGNIVVARYSLAREIRLTEKILIHNFMVLSECKKRYYQCSNEIQIKLIDQNDIALQSLVLLEMQESEVLSGVWQMMLMIYSGKHGQLGSVKIIEHFETIDCGLNARAC